MTDDRLRALVEAKIAEWRKEADAHYRYGDMRDDPYDDVAHEHKEKARVKRRYADEIESLIASGGSPEPEAEAARSSATFLKQHAGQLRHTEAVADCPHCNAWFLCEWVLKRLGPEPERPLPPGPRDPPRKPKAAQWTEHPGSPEPGCTDCLAQEWQRDGRGLWAMRSCLWAKGHDGSHRFGAWRYNVPLPPAPVVTPQSEDEDEKAPTRVDGLK